MPARPHRGAACRAAAAAPTGGGAAADGTGAVTSARDALDALASRRSCSAVSSRARSRAVSAPCSAERRLQFGVPGLQGAQLPDQARQLARGEILEVAKLGDIGSEGSHVVLQPPGRRRVRRSRSRTNAARASAREGANHCVATVARTIKGSQKTGGVSFEGPRKNYGLTSLNTNDFDVLYQRATRRITTHHREPVGRRPSSGRIPTLFTGQTRAPSTVAGLEDDAEIAAP